VANVNDERLILANRGGREPRGIGLDRENRIEDGIRGLTFRRISVPQESSRPFSFWILPVDQ